MIGRRVAGLFTVLVAALHCLPLLTHLLAAILHVLRVFRRVRGLRLSALLLGMLGMTGVGIGGGRALRGGGCRDGKRQRSKKYSHVIFSKI